MDKLDGNSSTSRISQEQKFEQGIDKLRAIQGELSRTINSLEGIISSRVHIVMPNEKLFEEDEKEPTAAIYLKKPIEMFILGRDK